jgi:predicted phage tail protein
VTGDSVTGHDTALHDRADPEQPARYRDRGHYVAYLTITGKTTSAFVKELESRCPNTGVYANKGWDIRCRLVEVASVDADPNFEKRTISWESMTASTIRSSARTRTGAAFRLAAALRQGQRQFQRRSPGQTASTRRRSSRCRPRRSTIPTTRAYTGAIWDGSWAKAYTNDPAWIINDAISDSLSGLARLTPGAHLNKWDALELSKYASELVSDGDTGTQPRFSLNLASPRRSAATTSSAGWRAPAAATAWDAGDGEWRCVVDKPKNPVALFTHENIEGEFVYSHTDIDTRFNDVTVVFLNEEFDYREDRVRIDGRPTSRKYGRKPTKVVGIGCTHRQQAVRWAILKMRTSINEFRAVTFTTNRQGKYIERFDWILVADQSLNMTVDELKRTSGRIVQNKGGSIVLRDTVRLEVGVAYTLRVTTRTPTTIRTARRAD